MDSFDPAAFIILGNLADSPDEDQNQQCAEIIFEAMKEVGVPQNRFEIFCLALVYKYNQGNFYDYTFKSLFQTHWQSDGTF